MSNVNIRDMRKWSLDMTARELHNVRGEELNSVLFQAVVYGRDDLILLLLDIGANINMVMDEIEFGTVLAAGAYIGPKR